MIMNSHRRPPRLITRGRQQGIVLIVAMIMLVVISMASVAIMRGAMSTDTVSDNTRRQAQALQFAQAALLYCENLVVNDKLKPAPAPGTLSTGTGSSGTSSSAVIPENWRVFSNWQENGKHVQVEQDFLVRAGQNIVVPHLPQCMAQYSKLSSSASPVVVVTARGFSDNYVEHNGQTQAGSVIWLQSVIQLKVPDNG